VVLETCRLVLRAPEPAEAAAYAAVWSNPDVVRYLGGKLWTLEDARDAISRMRRHWEWFGFGLFSVVRKEDERTLGRVGLLAWDPSRWTNGLWERVDEPWETEIGWTLGREFWGRGFATEAAIACRDWAFGSLGVGRLISLIAPMNAASIRVAEKLGERLEREDIGGPFPKRVDLYALGNPPAR
jgi:RimJ/RimL family protein N-acetyltransferase